MSDKAIFEACQDMETGIKSPEPAFRISITSGKTKKAKPAQISRESAGGIDVDIADSSAYSGNAAPAQEGSK